jgi:Fe-S cluster biosynthesis and repair protein YggX
MKCWIFTVSIKGILSNPIEEKSMAQRTVNCVKLQRELPGLEKPPFNDELGQRIFENVSQDAWKMFKEHFKMVMNEYRLALGTEEANRIFEQQVQDYFFGPGAALPPGYVPPKSK